jgi:type I restriction enzyme S subunit
MNIAAAKWEEVPLGSVCRVIPGYAFKSKDWCDEGIPVIKIKNIQSDRSVDTNDADCVPESIYSDRLKKFLLEDGDILLAMTGATAGKVGKLRTKQPMLLNQRVAKIKPVEADPEFIWAIVSSDEYQDKFFHLADGAAQPNMSGGQIERLTINLPDLPTQRKIAGILSAYDDLIENNLRRIKILEEMAQALYREWFVHFRFPGHESAKFVDSSLGQIPKGWEVKAIEQVAIVHRGRSYRSSELLDDGGLPFINLKCIVRDGGFRRDGIKCFDGPYKDSHKVVLGDIVMAVTDMTQERRIVARAARIPTLDADFGIVSMDLVKIEPRRGVSSAYLYAYFRCSDFADHLKQHANGANVLHLSPDRIKEHQFVMPDEQLRKRYSVTAGLHFEKIENLHRRIDILRRSRDLLLPKLLQSG